MDRITPHVREDHIEQIRSVQESTDSDISEAVRRIFDRASEADRTDAEIESIRSEYESKLDALRSGYESRIEDLERNVERLQNEKQTLIADRQEKQELVESVVETGRLNAYGSLYGCLPGANQ